MKHLWLTKRSMFCFMTALLFMSCIEGYKDDWTFSSGVEGVTLESPDAEGITVTKSADGSKMTVEWPVVFGAGGYQFSLYIIDDPENPVPVGEENVFIDGCSVERPLLEDTNYKISVKALGNPKYNNEEAPDPTEINYSTMLPATIIPDGTDLATYFTTEIIPDATTETAYELVAGGQYTLSAPIDFKGHWITIRGNKVDHPTLTYGEAGRLNTYGGLTLKFINFDCSAIKSDSDDGSLLSLSATPDPAILGTGDHYVISKPIVIQSCDIKGINRHLFFDNQVKYVVLNMLIKDCILELNTVSEGVIYLTKGNGFVNDFTISNSTVYSLVESNKYFLRYGNSGRPDRAGLVGGSINFYNNTFYNVVKTGQMGNYSGMNSALVRLNVMQNIFVDCGSQNVIRRLSAGGNNMTKTLKDNCYWYDGAFPQEGEIDHNNGDKSGTGYGVDPLFSDAAGHNFTVGNSTVISKRSGDPRWLPAAE